MRIKKLEIVGFPSKMEAFLDRVTYIDRLLGIAAACRCTLHLVAAVLT